MYLTNDDLNLDLEIFFKNIAEHTVELFMNSQKKNATVDFLKLNICQNYLESIKPNKKERALLLAALNKYNSSEIIANSLFDCFIYTIKNNKDNNISKTACKELLKRMTIECLREIYGDKLFLLNPDNKENLLCITNKGGILIPYPNNTIANNTYAYKAAGQSATAHKFLLVFQPSEIGEILESKEYDTAKASSVNYLLRIILERPKIETSIPEAYFRLLSLACSTRDYENPAFKKEFASTLKMLHQEDLSFKNISYNSFLHGSNRTQRKPITRF